MKEREGRTLDIGEFIEANKALIIDRWRVLAVERLALDLETSALLNDLPQFIDAIVTALRSPAERWPAIDSAQSHGRQRMQSGIDIGALTEEMVLIGEAVWDVCDASGQQPETHDVRRLSRVIGHGTSASVGAYAAMRDEELARHASRHFSFVAHELRTPLQTARMAATLLERASSDTRPGVLERLDRSLRRLADLVDNSILEVRLSSEPKLEVRTCRSNAIADSALEAVAYHAEARGIELDTEVEDFELVADRKLLTSALTNLLKNAVKFTHEGGRIVTRACLREGRAIFEVQDQCGGMPEDLPKRLFQPFVQEHANQSGFGLGLLIVKQAVEAHGGTVRVVNCPGEGCTFVIDLPTRGTDASQGPEDVDDG